MRTDGAAAHKRVGAACGRADRRAAPLASQRHRRAGDPGPQAAAAACGAIADGDDGRVPTPLPTACLAAIVALLFAACATSPPTKPAPDADRRAAARAEAEAAGNAAILAKLLAQYDANHDGKVQQAEYPRGAQAFANLDRNRDGAFDDADFRVPTPDPMAVLAQRRTDPARLPKVGDVAPDFELPMLGMPDTTVRLSTLRGERPVALVFGSFT